MRFQLPDGTDFEIPDEWWLAAGMPGFLPRGAYYSHTGSDERYAEVSAEVVPLTSIRPVVRTRPLDFGGFERDRQISVFKALVTGTAIPPIRAVAISGDQFGYDLHDGFHRYYASIAAKFTHIPIAAKEGYFTPWQ